MLKIKLSSLKPGARLGKDIYSYDGNLLLPKGAIITSEHLEAFARRQFDEVFIMETGTKISSEKNFEEVYSQSLDIAKSFMMEARLGKPLEFDEINDTVNLLVEQVFDQHGLFRQMRLMKNKDDYLFTHSVNVSLLCILIGRWLKCDDETIKNLGVAGLLHDIGKVFVENDILNKPDKLTAEEFEEIKKHTLLGYNLINQYPWVNAEVANAVLMHHERADGSGYPVGLKGYKIGFYASAVAVADVYDALTSSRVYSGKVSPYTAAEILWQESFGKLDPRISKVFYDKITDFYVGNEVILSNGMKGIVVYVDPSQPTRPIILAGDEFYNLAEERSITIQEIID
ncbi:HD domain [Syntrophomonas zehnderi OL-4]|uniref:HD domain n=1 Tax=Syntrophomonas zehnderi OL-4 TaxID=690567 RepID=A0A0E4GDM8_9FIRM|nr:HD-GYP domain-containing protein [Syntrophomonas zehnderi]CFX52233.1 HD domain [Syntrophomonas zehnderi OL-4]